jgi:hypothetical protein
MLYRMFHPYLHPDFIFNLSSKGRQHKKYLSILHGFTRKGMASHPGNPGTVNTRRGLLLIHPPPNGAKLYWRRFK